MEKKKDMKKNRIKSYFLEAAKKIIIEDGTDGISVRKVADQAGYSYATIYNYYRDLHELLYDVKLALVMDLREYLTGNVPRQPDKADLQEIFKTYVTYYVENPNIYRFFYNYPLNSEKDGMEGLFTVFHEISLEAEKDFTSSGISQSEIAGKTCIYAVQGMLMLYFSFNGMTKEALYRDLSAMLDYCFQNCVDR